MNITKEEVIDKALFFDSTQGCWWVLDVYKKNDFIGSGSFDACDKNVCFFESYSILKPEFFKVLVTPNNSDKNYRFDYPKEEFAFFNAYRVDFYSNGSTEVTDVTDPLKDDQLKQEYYKQKEERTSLMRRNIIVKVFIYTVLTEIILGIIIGVVLRFRKPEPKISIASFTITIAIMNIVSYPLFIVMIIALGGSLGRGIIIFGEAIVVLMEAVIIRKRHHKFLTNKQSFAISLLLNISSIVVGFLFAVL